MTKRIVRFDIEEVSLVDKAANGTQFYSVKRLDGVAPDPVESAIKRVESATALAQVSQPKDSQKALIAAASVAEVLMLREKRGGLSNDERETIKQFVASANCGPSETEQSNHGQETKTPGSGSGSPEAESRPHPG